MITTKQRAYLRKLGNAEETLFQIGKGGITENLIKQVDEALNARELIKLRVLETSLLSAKEALGEICEKTSAEPVQAIGSRFLLYRQAKKQEKRRINLENC